MNPLNVIMPLIATLSSAQATSPAVVKPAATPDPMQSFEQWMKLQPPMPSDVNAPPKYPALLPPKQMNLSNQLKSLPQIQQEAADKYKADKAALTDDRSEQFKAIYGKTDATTNRLPYQSVVLHKPAINNLTGQLAVMQSQYKAGDKAVLNGTHKVGDFKGIGYNELLNQRGLNIQLGSDDVRPVHIKQPNHKERLDTNIKEQRPDMTNENAYSIGVYGSTNEKINSRLFERVAEIYAKNKIPLERMAGEKVLPNYPIGHGQIQHSPEGASWPRQKLSGGKEEGADLQKLFIDNWDTFSKLVNTLKEEK